MIFIYDVRVIFVIFYLVPDYFSKHMMKESRKSVELVPEIFYAFTFSMQPIFDNETED